MVGEQPENIPLDAVIDGDDVERGPEGGYGAEGVLLKSASELGPALKKALAAKVPTLIQAPMENAPTPTPGHWNINDIYRQGK